MVLNYYPYFQRGHLRWQYSRRRTTASRRIICGQKNNLIIALLQQTANEIIMQRIN